jgi:hypothetical protein
MKAAILGPPEETDLPAFLSVTTIPWADSFFRSFSSALPPSPFLMASQSPAGFAGQRFRPPQGENHAPVNPQLLCTARAGPPSQIDPEGSVGVTRFCNNPGERRVFSREDTLRVDSTRMRESSERSWTPRRPQLPRRGGDRLLLPSRVGDSEEGGGWRREDRKSWRSSPSSMPPKESPWQRT